MKRMSMPDAVELIAAPDEWSEFQEWRKQPKPIMLDRHGKFPDVPHDLADNLFERLIDRLKSGELVAFGLWGSDRELSEIESMHWSGMLYNIWYNELGYADEGRVGFKSIVVAERTGELSLPSKPQARSAINNIFRQWCQQNRDAKITREDMIALIKAQLGDAYELSDNLIISLWRAEFPRSHKFMNRPPGS